MTYPNFAGKHEHATLTEPAAFVQYWVDQGRLPAGAAAPAGVILLYQRPLFDAVRHQPDVSPFAPVGPRHRAFLDLHTFDGTDGTVGVVGRFGIGAPAATAVLESLAALGARRFIGVGTAGALVPELAAGDVVVCSRAVRDEGVSHHYLPSARWAEPASGLTARLTDRLDAVGLAPIPAAAWTIDAPYRETVAEARHYVQDGVAVVEMEAAAPFHRRPGTRRRGGHRLRGERLAGRRRVGPPLRRRPPGRPPRAHGPRRRRHPGRDRRRGRGRGRRVTRRH